MNPKDKLIVALDILDKKKCFDMVDMLAPVVDVFKVGIAPHTAFGEELLKKLDKLNKKVFLDLKFHDIPNTVKNAAIVSAEKNIFMMNFHAIGGEKMLEAAKEGARETEKRTGKRPLLIAVTVLTSMTKEDLEKIGIEETPEEKVKKFALMTKNFGMDGVVASAKEASLVKEICGQAFIVVTPGIRPEWSAKGDQERVLTPKKAMEEGADYLVVGRPIIANEDPVEAAKKILEEMI